MATTATRNADLPEIVEILRSQHARKLDVVTSATNVRARDGQIRVRGAEQLITDDGVTSVDGTYQPTAVFDEGVAAKLGIPLTYLRKLRTDRPDIYDMNVNGWLHGKGRMVDGQLTVVHPADSRQFLLRLFRDDDGGTGVARALLSDKYARIENLDVLMATLDAIRDVGVETQIVGADLSDRRMYVRIAAPAVQALAPALLGNYRSPFTGAVGADNPTVFAGFEISNSEVGGGAFSITPRLIVQVCNNGMQITKDALRSVHLGGRLDEGVINWTEATQRKALELIQAKTRDAVTTFLDTAYMTRVIAGITEQAGVKLPDPAATLSTLGKKLNFDETTSAGILNHFIQGGDTTAGGIMQAITSYAQTVPDADDASDLEGVALRALALAASE